MPDALISLPDVSETVTRRVAVDAVRQLATLMRLPPETKVLLPGYHNSIPMNNGTFGMCGDPNQVFPSDSRLLVTYREEVDEGRVLTTPVRRDEHAPIFLDDVRDVMIRPVFRYVTMTLSVEYTAPSRVLAQRWLDQMRSQISAGRTELYMDLEYHYAIPDAASFLLLKIHELTQKQFPTQETYKEYLDHHYLVPTTVVTTLDDRVPRRVVPQHQFEVLGWFDINNTPEEPQGSEIGTWTSTINYTLHYDRPMQLYCRYPLLIHNQLVGPEIRPTKPYRTFRSKTRRVSQTKGSFDAVLNAQRDKGVTYVQYPEIDDWVPRYPPHSCLTFFTGLLILSPDDPYTLLDLSDLGDYVLHPAIQEWVRHQGVRALDPTESVLLFHLYENKELCTRTHLSLEGTLIKATHPLDLTRYYHLQISVQRNWFELSPEVIQCLRRYPTAMYVLLQALGVSLGGGEQKELSLLGVGYNRGKGERCPGEGDGLAGTVTQKDTIDAVKATDDKQVHSFEGMQIGPMNVLYAQLIALKDETS